MLAHSLKSSSDAARYGGSNRGNMGGVDAVPVPLHGRTHSLTLTLPPLGVVFLKRSPSPTLPREAEEGEEAPSQTELEPDSP
ncbi:MAG TPA: alpha amylase C-terminal domain-containing protein [Thermoanaerobaculia bacterium]|nr:alpha amylase C-terminal domain-containing protein [Thermoanaerobaculia bacterium]